MVPEAGSAPVQLLEAAVLEAVQEAPGSLEDQVRTTVPPGDTDPGVAVRMTVGPGPVPPLLEAPPPDDPLSPGPPLAEHPASARPAISSRAAAPRGDWVIGFFMICVS